MGSRWQQERHETYNALQWVHDTSFLQAIRSACGTGQAILELGCGTGTNLEAVRDAFQRRVGVEASQEMIDKIRDPGIERVHALLQDIDFEQEFDCVLLRNVLHYVEYPAEGLAVAFRALRPGGQLVLVEGVPPNSQTQGRYEEIFSHLDRRHIFHEGDLIRLARGAGFRDLLLRPFFLENVDIFDWIDKRTPDEQTQKTLKRLHTSGDDHFREAYEMREEAGRLLMTWRFAVLVGKRPV